MSKIFKLLPIFISITMLTGCQSTNLQTHSFNQYTFQYPNTYLIEEPTESFPVLVVRGNKGRVEIFKNTDFNDPVSKVIVERTHGYSSSGLEKYEANYVPKEKYEIDDYDVWLFYQAGDEETKNEIQDIFMSIIKAI